MTPETFKYMHDKVVQAEGIRDRINDAKGLLNYIRNCQRDGKGGLMIKPCGADVACDPRLENVSISGEYVADEFGEEPIAMLAKHIVRLEREYARL